MPEKNIRKVNDPTKHWGTLRPLIYKGGEVEPPDRLLVKIRKFLFREKYKEDFIRILPARALILDVGCGNDSAKFTKSIRPDLFYIGLDVGDYNNTSPTKQWADKYIVVRPEKFAEEIKSKWTYNAVISSHNLEHCLYPDEVLDAMLTVIKPGGCLYLSFPSAASAYLPKRGGTLNFFDDGSHVKIPDYAGVIKKIKEEGLEIVFSAERYRPLRLVIRGLINELQSRKQNKVMRGTWALYGFETIIWARRPE